MFGVEDVGGEDAVEVGHGLPQGVDDVSGHGGPLEGGERGLRLGVGEGYALYAVDHYAGGGEGERKGRVADEGVAKAVVVGYDAVVVDVAYVVLCPAAYLARGQGAPLVVLHGHGAAHGRREEAVVGDVDGSYGREHAHGAAVALEEHEFAAAHGAAVDAEELACGGIYEGPVAEIELVDVGVAELVLVGPAGGVGVAYEVPPHHAFFEGAEHGGACVGVAVADEGVGVEVYLAGE